MKAAGILTLTLAVLFVLAPPEASAQAPAPKVTITGIIDNLVNYNVNQGESATDRNTLGFFTNRQDKEFYGRTRGRFDIIGELGKGRAVLGLEVDCVYGATGASPTSNLGKQVSAGFRPDGSGCTFGADNDVTGAIEIKWMYVDVPATGPGSLLPFIPWAGTLTLGGQPYALGLKPSILADSDFGGATYRVTFTPNVKASLTYAQIEESSVGVRGGFFRGDDWGVIAKLDVSPFRELRLSPIATYQDISGTTSALLRRGTGGYAVGGANFAPDQSALPAGVSTVAAVPGPGVACLGVPCKAATENRYIVGLDADWRSGPVHFNPTFFYEFGNRQRFPSATDPGRTGVFRTADMKAWIADLEGGYQLGPLLLEARALYTPGNKVQDNLNEGVIRSYQPFQTGNSYWIGWGEAHTIGNIDYLTSFGGFSNSFSQAGNIGYDRFGRAEVSFRARYAITPAFSVYGIVTPIWTAEGIPTGRVTPSANGLVCVNQGVGTRICDRRDAEGSKKHYIGTDLTAGITWQFAPGLTFDYVFGYLIAGNALDNLVDRCAFVSAPACNGFVKRDAKDTYVTTARIRFAF